MSEVINAHDPLGALAQLRTWQLTLESAVDTVVGAHHNSFSRSIQNYSEIVHLFEGSQHNVGSLRTVFAEAHTRLTTGIDDRSTLKAMWCQGITLQQLTHRLEEVERLTQVSAKIRVLVSNGHYMPAIELAVESCATLITPEFATVEVAVHDLRRECMACTEIVRSQVHVELVKIMFCRQLKCPKTSWDSSKSARSGSEKLRGGGLETNKREQATVRDVTNGGGGAGSDGTNSSSSGDDNINLKFEVEDDNEFLTDTMLGVTKRTHASNTQQMSYLVACLVSLGHLSRTYATLEHTISTQVGELVLDELVHCLARKDALFSLAVSCMPNEWINCESGGLNNDESCRVMEVVIDHLFCLFRLVLSRLGHLEMHLKVCGVDCLPALERRPSLMSCAVNAMETSLTCAITGLLSRGDCCMDACFFLEKASGRQNALRRWTAGDERRPSDEERHELPTFMFQGDHTDGGDLGDTETHSDLLRRACDDICEDSNIGGSNLKNAATGVSLSDAVSIAAQHLQAALGVFTTPHAHDVVVQLVRELLAEIMPKRSEGV